MAKTRHYSQFFALCKAQGFEKEELAGEISKGRTSSLRALTDQEFDDVLEYLKHLQHKKTDWTPKPGDLQRKKMISLGRQMNWGTATAPTTPASTPPAPTPPAPMKGGEGRSENQLILERLDGWCLKQKYKKALMEHTVPELNILVSIFEGKVFKSYLENLNK
jgi:hypothetical protein